MAGMTAAMMKGGAAQAASSPCLAGLSARKRARIERALERLEDLRQAMIRVLDEADQDTDLEPSLGFLEVPMGSVRWIGVNVSQGTDRLCGGSRIDLEDEHDGREQDDWDESDSDGCIDNPRFATTCPGKGSEEEAAWQPAVTPMMEQPRRRTERLPSFRPGVIQGPDGHPWRFVPVA